MVISTGVCCASHRKESPLHAEVFGAKGSSQLVASQNHYAQDLAGWGEKKTGGEKELEEDLCKTGTCRMNLRSACHFTNNDVDVLLMTLDDYNNWACVVSMVWVAECPLHMY